MGTQAILGAALAAGCALIAAAPTVDNAPAIQVASTQVATTGEDMFRTSDRCLACHKGVSTSAGEDVSIGFDWRASMMANSARDPYWQAAVRREIMDHPDARAAIEDKCSTCHMPMARAAARADGLTGTVFDNVPVGGDGPYADLAADGVSCSLCHQIRPDGLGEESSFTGGFHVPTGVAADGRTAFGPFEPDAGGATIMRSATDLRPTQGLHIQSAELCASCHTLFTHAARSDGSSGPEFPEQAPYLEWQASDYGASGTPCQDCHMPLVGEDVPVTQVLGTARPDVSRHVFRGGNFFMLRMLNRYRNELGVMALPQELALAVDRTVDHLSTSTVELVLGSPELVDGRLEFDVEVRNLAGHKFPTAYPSRRAWLNVRVRDAGGSVVFESGSFRPDGSIAGNDHDEDPRRFEPHHSVISEPGDVQIYEAVMGDGEGRVTTGLMSAERWLKDNRLLPRGFDARAADARVAVVGGARSDADFAAGLDRVRYTLGIEPARGPFTIDASLWFQPIGYRWAQNLAEYDAFETRRFVRYYESMAPTSAIRLQERSTSTR